MEDARADGRLQNLSFALVEIRSRSAAITLEDSADDFFKILSVDRVLPDHESRMQFKWDADNGWADFGAVINYKDIEIVQVVVLILVIFIHENK
jgi:hypothetical protein